MRCSDAQKQVVLGALISRLQEHGWDCEEESLASFLDDPAIVEAFEDCDVYPTDNVIEHEGVRYLVVGSATEVRDGVLMKTQALRKLD